VRHDSDVEGLVGLEDVVAGHSGGCHEGPPLRCYPPAGSAGVQLHQQVSGNLGVALVPAHWPVFRRGSGAQSAEQRPSELP
jgi:hypothetical protein